MWRKVLDGRKVCIPLMVQQEASVHETSAGVLAGIGDTPLVELRRLVPRTGARVLMKLEWANPTGSMNDRMAKTAIAAAESDSRVTSG
jgi:cysteine synthase